MVGTEFSKLIAQLGLKSPRFLTRRMERWGVDGCRRRINRLAEDIRQNVVQWGWQEKLSNGTDWKALGIDPADPICGLIQQAIYRAASQASYKPAGAASDWVDPLVVCDRFCQPVTGLRNILAGGSVFLAGGGPSANLLPLEQLNRRGVWTCCINNMGAHARFRPQAFVCTDPPEKFHDTIWLDKAVMKFVPDAKLYGGRANLRTKNADGSFSALLLPDGSVRQTKDCANTWGVKRRKWMLCDDTFFTDDAAPNGNYQEGVNKTGERKTICTMIFAIRILRYLGASRVFLLGVDFKMDPSKPLDQNYSFGELRDEGACRSNNSQYLIVNDWLMRLEANGVFAKFGMNLYNCNQHSSLRAFPYVPFEQALELVCDGCQEVPDAQNWYSKEHKKKRK